MGTWDVSYFGDSLSRLLFRGTELGFLTLLAFFTSCQINA